jgi:hypothetical protein
MNTKIISAKVHNGTSIALFDRAGNQICSTGASGLHGGGENYTTAQVSGDILTAVTNRGAVVAYQIKDGCSPAYLHRR